MSRTKVVVIDMQPITPAIGGGRKRLHGLFHRLGQDIDAVYVGSYDWRGEPGCDVQISPGLREICVPLSDEHYAAAETLAGQVGKVVIDATFSQLATLSPEWIDTARKWIDWADVVVFEHPWAYTPLKRFLKPGQLLVYGAHNVESFLKAESLGMVGVAENVIREVVRNEYDLLLDADLVGCCSEEDVSQFSRIFQIPDDKFRIAPNGAFTRASGSILERRASARESLLPCEARPIAVFMGSQYGPNADAARFIVGEVAPAHPDILFALIGSVSEALGELPVPKNVRVEGVVADVLRDAWLLRADVALNPMSAGSGTNVKMFDYLAAGLPVLTTAIGARGICDASTAPPFLDLVPLAEFPDALSPFVRQQSQAARHFDAWSYVDRRFSWEAISEGLGRVLQDGLAAKKRGDTGQKTVLLMTPWNIRCGIGEYSVQLAKGIRENGHKVVVFGNFLKGHDPTGFKLELDYPVVRGWRWDNIAWRDSAIDQGKYRNVLDRVRPGLVVLQHHTAYLPPHDYLQAVRMAREGGATVVVETHDARNLSDDVAVSLVEAGASLVVHSREERAGFPREVQAATSVIPLSVYVPRSRGTPRIATAERPVIAGFGFLRPYKGVHIAIQAMAAIRKHVPEAVYEGWHSLYPGSESEAYFDECMRLVRELGLDDAVSIETDFKPIEEVIDRLASSTLVLLPYEPSVEGASAAANAAIAAGRPLVVSGSEIFCALGDACIRAPQHTAQAYAKTIVSLLEDERRLEQHSRRARDWALDNSHTAAAQKILAYAG